MSGSLSFDYDSAIERVGGDVTLLRELVAMASANVREVIPTLRSALPDSESARILHRLRAAYGNVGACAVVEQVDLLRACRTANNDAELRLAVARLEAAVQEFECEFTRRCGAVPAGEGG